MKYCRDCKSPCHKSAIRCKTCNNILTNNTKKRPPNFCIDCGKQIGRQARRCNHCAHWKGGIRQDSKGYRMVFAPDHPRGKRSIYVFEHILIWEKANGRLLPTGWIIHHLNGIKKDNRILNLVALPNRKHYLVLQSKAKRIQELEALLNGQHQLL